MKTLRKFAWLACFGVLVVAFQPNAQAGLQDKKTWVTFQEPVALPGGVVLQPGEYTMKVLVSPWNPNVVQVMNRDETKIYATILAKSTERKEAGDLVIALHEESAVGEPRPLCTWFYPGRRIGWEFHSMGT